MTICSYNARTFASEAAIEDLIMQAKKIKYDIIVLTETRRRHPLNAVYETGEELFLGEEEVEAFYMDLEKFYREDHVFYKVIGDFNAKVGPRRTPEELHIGTHGLQWNDQEERLSEFIMTTKTIHENSFCLTDVAVVPKFNTGSDHRLLRGRFSFTRRAEKAAKFRERNPRTIVNWDLFATLAGFWEDPAMDNIDEEYDRLVEHLHDCAKKAESFKTTKRRLSLETVELIRQRGAARAAGNQELTSELARLCGDGDKRRP
ncbi:hypothetical protein RB195_007556 [Necator americanus]|uniref:Endonuclease/exonuclease/phosphatase domain-containing protein n=1 Tax=Necator americanus TaxID=51031 RepID=A0ABR1BZE9_NECAM